MVRKYLRTHAGAIDLQDAIAERIHENAKEVVDILRSVTSDEIDLVVNLLEIGVESEGIVIRLVKSLETSIRKDLRIDQVVFHPRIPSILVTEDVEGSVIIAKKIIMIVESIAAETNVKNTMIEM